MRRHLQPQFCTLIAAFFLCGAVTAHGQNKPQRPASAEEAAPRAQHYNPLRAVQDVEVGKFYMDQDHWDAAIARFKDAILYKPHYAEPRLYLGKAYEKKNDPRTAIRYYQQYLKILPHTKESRKVRKRIAKLRKEIKKGTASGGSDQE